MKSSTKILSILAASSLVASIPVVLAQSAPPPPPPPPPPAAPAMTGGGPGNGGGRGQGGPGQGGFQGAPQDVPTAAEFATLNKALKDILSKDADAAKVLAAHPTWNPLTPPFVGGRGGRQGGAPGAGAPGAGG